MVVKKRQKKKKEGGRRGMENGWRMESVSDSDVSHYDTTVSISN